MKSIIKSVLAGILFWSAAYWTCVLSWAIETDWLEMLVVFVFMPILTNCIVGFLLIGKNFAWVGINIAVSALFGVLTFFIYGRSNFLYYWLNVIFPGYGDMSAGGSFAMTVIFIFFIIFYILTLIIAFAGTAIRRKNSVNQPVKRLDLKLFIKKKPR